MKIRRLTSLSIPILTYHSIDNSGSVISTSPEKFRVQMEHLIKTSSTVISLRDVVTYIRENSCFPTKTVAIAFDDGFKNFFQIAYPVLKDFGFKATVFLVAGYCGKKNRWFGQPQEIPKLDLLEWGEIRQMTDNGIDFGAHSVNHPNLLKIPFDQAVQEIVGSKSMIERYIGEDVSFFAYPYGNLNTKIKRIVEEKFYGACTTELGLVNMKSDIYALPRIDMYYFSKNNFFTWYGKSIFWLYILARSALRSLRKRDYAA